MRSIVITIFLSFILSVNICIAEDNMKPDISTLDWLAGDWEGDFEGNPFECHYTSPDGGAILSVSKEFHEGKPCFIEFEKFIQTDSSIILTPYPGGKQSVEFALIEYDPSIKRAKFVNYEHDFPTEITYELTAESKMKIVIAGNHNGKRMELVVSLKKVN